MTLINNLYNYYRSTPMREGVLCWYPFMRETSVLDLSGGVLTELLKSRCERVYTKETGGERFDYIVVMDPEDFGVDSLRSYFAQLNPHGRLILAFENPFALRYWSGKISPRTGFTYDSLLGRDGRASKAEMQLRLRKAGFEGQKWYYPLTDHWFAREIYSEKYLPDEYLNQRFVAYIEDGEYLQFDERVLYREVIRNGAFEFMCGAYLVEARICGDDKPCPVDYAAVTAYREPSKRFATTVLNDGTVRKMPLHRDGHERILKILRNHEELTGLGVNTLPMKIEGDALIMPRLELPILWDYWARKLSDGTFDYDEMVRHFDRIRDSIYKASVNGKCFWELVPANCFYDESKDELIFFDQEYYWENRSPDIAVTRAVWALRYSPAFSGDPRAESRLAELKVRYGLNEHWDELSELADVETLNEVFGDGAAILERESERAEDGIWSRERERKEKEGVSTLHRQLRRQKFLPVPGKLREMGFKNPIIYGYGKRGRDLSRVLRAEGMEPAAIIDRVLRKYPDIELMKHDISSDIIIISVLDGADAIRDDLNRRTGLPIVILEDLLEELSNEHVE